MPAERARLGVNINGGLVSRISAVLVGVREPATNHGFTFNDLSLYLKLALCTAKVNANIHASALKFQSFSAWNGIAP